MLLQQKKCGTPAGMSDDHGTAGREGEEAHGEGVAASATGPVGGGGGVGRIPVSAVLSFGIMRGVRFESVGKKFKQNSTKKY